MAQLPILYWTDINGVRKKIDPNTLVQQKIQQNQRHKVSGNYESPGGSIPAFGTNLFPQDIGKDPRADNAFANGINYSIFEDPELARSLIPQIQEQAGKVAAKLSDFERRYRSGEITNNEQMGAEWGKINSEFGDPSYIQKTVEESAKSMSQEVETRINPKDGRTQYKTISKTGTEYWSSKPPKDTAGTTSTQEDPDVAVTASSEEVKAQQDAKSMSFLSWKKLEGNEDRSFKEWKALKNAPDITAEGGATGEAGEGGAEADEGSYEELLKKYSDFISLRPEERAAKYPALTAEISNLTDKAMGDFFHEVKEDIREEEQKLLNRTQEDFVNEMNKINTDAELDLRAKNDALEELLNNHKLKIEQLDVQKESQDAAYFDAIKSVENGVTNFMTKSGISEEQAMRHTEEFVSANLREQGYKRDQYDKYVAKMTEQHAQKGIAFSGESLKAINEVNEERAREMFELKTAVQSKTADLEDYKKLLDLDRTSAIQGLAEKLGSEGASAFLTEQGIEFNPSELEGFSGSLTRQREESEKLLDLARRGLEEGKRAGEADIGRAWDKSEAATEFARGDTETGRARQIEDIMQAAKEEMRELTEEEKRTIAEMKQTITEDKFGGEMAPWNTMQEMALATGAHTPSSAKSYAQQVIGKERGTATDKNNMTQEQINRVNGAFRTNTRTPEQIAIDNARNEQEKADKVYSDGGIDKRGQLLQGQAYLDNRTAGGTGREEIFRSYAPTSY